MSQGGIKDEIRGNISWWQGEKKMMGCFLEMCDAYVNLAMERHRALWVLEDGA